MAPPDEDSRTIGRRHFMLGAAGAVASACVVGSLDGSVAAALSNGGRGGVAPVPTAIPGGLDVGGGAIIHVWSPGDPAVTLPFSQGVLGGFDVEPSTITDFSGSTALAYHAGTARGSDGKSYNLETDMRAFEGDFVLGGRKRHGAFGLV